jgi:choline-sulfatase
MKARKKLDTNRRQFLKFLACCAASAPLWPHVSVDKLYGQVAQNRPNVLFIILDDLNDWVGCLGGNADVKTPNLDRLAQRGVLFTNAHCSAPLCNPSRVSFLTGIRPSTSGIYTNNQQFRSVLPNAVTIPQHFMAHGYGVAGGGKFFHFPDSRSWQRYFPSLKRTIPEDPDPRDRPLNGIPKLGYFDWGPVDVGDDAMGDGQVARWAISELQGIQKKPFFLGVGLHKPHLPQYCPQKYFDLYPADRIALPTVNDHDLDDVPRLGIKYAETWKHQKVIEHNQWRNAVSGYLANVSFVDAQVGRILDTLDHSPYAGNTIIVLLSDNGYHLGEKSHWTKSDLWEEATRCPLMIVAPGVTVPGGRCRRTVSLVDLYPTLVELCGLTPRTELDGVSLLPLLTNPQAEWDRPAVSTHLANNHSVRSERWRYTRYRDGTEELYDHRTDDLEWTNLADNPGYAEVKAELARWLPGINAPMAP